MDMRTCYTQLGRASKRLNHATRALEEAPTPRAQARHERRIRMARKAAADARYTWEMLTLTEA